MYQYLLILYSLGFQWSIFKSFFVRFEERLERFVVLICLFLRIFFFKIVIRIFVIKIIIFFLFKKFSLEVFLMCFYILFEVFKNLQVGYLRRIVDWFYIQVNIWFYMFCGINQVIKKCCMRFIMFDDVLLICLKVYNYLIYFFELIIWFFFMFF